MSEEPLRRRHPLEDEPLPPTEETEAEHKRKMIPIIVDNRTPIVTYLLLFMNVAIFFIGYVLPQLNETLLTEGMLVPYLVLRDFQLHRLFTAMFLHASIPHIVLNMISLYRLGPDAERIYGRYRFILIYMLGGLAGSILSAGIGDYTIPSVGASGAVLAIWASHMWLIYNNRVFYGERALELLRADVLYLLFFIMIGFAPGSQIDNWGHIGGFLGGLGIAYLIPVQFKAKLIKRSGEETDMVIMDENRLSMKMLPQIGLMVGVLIGLFLLAVLGFRFEIFGGLT